MFYTKFSKTVCVGQKVPRFEAENHRERRKSRIYRQIGRGPKCTLFGPAVFFARRPNAQKSSFVARRLQKSPRCRPETNPTRRDQARPNSQMQKHRIFRQIGRAGRSKVLGGLDLKCMRLVKSVEVRRQLPEKLAKLGGSVAECSYDASLVTASCSHEA